MINDQIENEPVQVFLFSVKGHMPDDKATLREVNVTAEDASMAVQMVADKHPKFFITNVYCLMQVHLQHDGPSSAKEE